MDHSHHAMDHGMPAAPGAAHKCSMNMLFTWDTKDLCIVFRQWHIGSTLDLVLSLAAIVAIGAGYEFIRSLTRRYESAVKTRVDAAPRQNQDQIAQRAHVVKALLYSLQTFYAFMLMLVFMTYNGWVMVAVTIGAFVGYLAFGSTGSATRETACH